LSNDRTTYEEFRDSSPENRARLAAEEEALLNEEWDRLRREKPVRACGVCGTTKLRHLFVVPGSLEIICDAHGHWALGELLRKRP